MFLIAGNQTGGLTRQRHFEERFIIRIRQRMGQRGGCNSLATTDNIIKQGGDLFFRKAKPWATQNFVVFR